MRNVVLLHRRFAIGRLVTEKGHTMYRVLVADGLVATSIGITGCGSYASSPTTPGDGSPPPAGAVVIDVLGEHGDRSFSPNPATVPAGTTVVWHNADGETHRVVLDDRQLDTGNIAPGAYSAPMTLRAATPYHCSIHPTMVGMLTRGVTESEAESTGTSSAPTAGY